ncbi:hypothetical protein EVAR_78730_1 [Eumeta japonica]|uniref:Uncharacterized protein n=1 Tax=Eumeta variegata TaxID=151549 RepID=A0A4C1T224_EUMVA|nr:hypothetical protein EVAR_78730_1 [Eumeta japonica]
MPQSPIVPLTRLTLATRRRRAATLITKLLLKVQHTKLCRSEMPANNAMRNGPYLSTRLLDSIESDFITFLLLYNARLESETNFIGISFMANRTIPRSASSVAADGLEGAVTHAAHCTDISRITAAATPIYH